MKQKVRRYSGNEPHLQQPAWSFRVRNEPGFLSTHFTYMKCGSLHRANGGYLILSASDLLKNPGAWHGLKRALKEGLIHMQPTARMSQGEVLAKTLDPEPIELDVKINFDLVALIYIMACLNKMKISTTVQSACRFRFDDAAQCGK